ncbi:MAG: hypothetical protein HQL98_13955 [Magnetococcales bacterium]|nr:hypothetical protein [Magnetococcales bacterium]
MNRKLLRAVFNLPWFTVALLWLVMRIASADPAQPGTEVQSVGQTSTKECHSCHEWRQSNPTRRTLKFPHKAITLHHGPNLWCLDCHQSATPERLVLPEGNSASFQEVYRLCGMCHGRQLKEWRVGVHGKRADFWDGPRILWRCTTCHNPHAPIFPSIAPASATGHGQPDR